MDDQRDRRVDYPPGATPTAEDEKGSCSIGQAAALLGVNRVTVWRWIRAGRLPAVRVGHRTVRIRRDDLARLLTETGTGPPRTAPTAAALAAGAPLPDRAADTPGHLAQFYEHDDSLLDAAADFLATALCTGDAALVVATGPHRAAIEERLCRHGLDLDAARETGRYAGLDAAETLAQIMVDGQPQPARFRKVVGGAIARAGTGGRRVRVYGEMVALLAEEGNHPAALLLERLWGELQSELPFTLLCGYSMDAFADEALAELFEAICAEHDRVVPAESYTTLLRPEERLRAIANLQQKARALEAEIDRNRETERELRHQEAALRDFVEHAPIGLHWVGVDGTILWANQAELELLGYRAEEYIGRSIAEFHVDQDVARDILRRLAAGETLTNYEARLRCKDGTIKHVLLSANVVWEGATFRHTRCFTIDITPRKRAEQRLAVQYAVTRALATADTLAQAAAGVLREVCETLGWEVGTFWSVDHDAGVLRCHGFWHASNIDAREFEAASRRTVLHPGRGLPGRVWTSGRPIWIPDITHDAGFPRVAQATRAGLHTALAFPIRLGDEVHGVLELFCRELRRPEEELLAFMAALGGQIGQFIERKRAEAERTALLERERAARAAAEEQAEVHVRLNAALRELAQERAQALAEVEAARAAAWAAERRLQALVTNIVDVILVLDAEGRVQYASPTAARVLGYPPEAYPQADAFSFIHPDDREGVQQAFLDALRTPGMHQWMEFRVRHADGSWRVVEAATNVLLDDPDVRGAVVNVRDITERKRVEEELQASEARLRLALDAGRMGTWDWTIATDTVVWSANLEDIHGLPSGSFGGTFADFARGVYPEDRERVLAAIARALDEGAEYHVEYRTVWPDGSLHWLEARGRVFRDAAGRPVRMSGVCADVTERKCAEARLAARERQQAAVAQLGQLALSGVDLDTLFARAVAAVSQTLGTEFVKLLELLPEGTNLLLRAGVGWREELVGRATVGAGHDSHAGYTLRCGQPVIVEDWARETRFASSPLLREHGVVSGVSVIVAGGERPFGVLGAHTARRRTFTADDVNFLLSVANVLAMAISRAWAERERARLLERAETARAAAERERQRLHELFQQAPAAVAVLRGPAHVIEVVNSLMQELLGPRELIGRPVRVAMPELADQGFFELLDCVYATGRAEVRTGVRARWLRDGAPVDRYFNFVYQPLRDGEGRVEGILVHMVEVTDLVHARRQVEALAAERDAFLAAASHDLKTPLTTVKGTAQLLRRWLTRPGEVERERLVTGLDTIDATSNQMLGLINELLDATRVRLGQPLALERQPTDLVALTHRVVALQQAATDRHRLHVETTVETLVGTWDAARLERVLGNLLSNAVKYSPGGGEVRIELTREEDATGRWAVVRVRDQGVGIPAADLPHIFEPFYRASNVTGRVGGSGIGLAGARRIIAQHGGAIHVESREGKGSTVTVRLPLDVTPDDGSAHAGPRHAGVHPTVAERTADRHGGMRAHA